MKEWTLQFDPKDVDNLEDIRSGLKLFETRAATPKYQKIAVGDMLVLVCGTQLLSKKVVGVQHFRSVEEMVGEIPLIHIMPHIHYIEAMKERYASYPGYDEKIKEFGLLAFEMTNL